MPHLKDNFRDSHVCIIGLGYVGLTLATVMAGSGFHVTGIEIRPDVLELLRVGKPHFFEPGLEGRLKKAIHDRRMEFFSEIPVGCRATVFIITVGTPLGIDGRSRMDPILVTARQVAKVLKQGDVVILRSTVKLGTTRHFVLPTLQETGMAFDLAFCPERTLEGKALVELRQLPQIVGGLNLASTIRASQIFQFITPTVVRVSDVETAEMVKLIDNANRDIMFAYANEVARGCDALGISAVEVIQAGKLGYSRTNLPMPGPVGGPCLEKDPYILAEGLQELGISPEITLVARHINERQPIEVAAYLSEQTRGLAGFPDEPVISLMGLAFKGQPVTDDLRGTMAKPVLAALKSEFPNGQFRGYDAMVARDEIAKFGLNPCASIEEAMAGAHLVVILNNHPDFLAMPVEVLSGTLAKPGLIYDFWNIFSADELSLADGVGYVALGSHGRGILPGKHIRG
ncbi:MAG: UDP-glucose 6-dehydrogenase [Chloroflexi bacterium RBG_16_52_11]|nr:MAG: UDP-glucose 6-dehydrogenase [Chloroflexi bacterium RBG_16_52_11]